MIIPDMQLTRNFKLSEFKCRHCDKVLLPDMELVYKLQLLRDMLGKPITTSGYRCPEYNKILIEKGIKASPDSLHLKGVAADITSLGISPEELCYLAKKAGFSGIGIYDAHVHVDTRDTPTFWDWREKNKGKKLTILV